MIGPSSSHTAGACKLGYMARIIFGVQPKKVILDLHGSFGEVYSGHCTDVALMGGLLGLLPWDPRITEADVLAKQKGMEVELRSVNLGSDYHPNTVRFILSDGVREQVIIGSSIGGGKIIMSSIDKVEVAITGSYSSLLVCYDMSSFNIQGLLELLGKKDISIVKMETTNYKNRAIIDIEIKEKFYVPIIHEIESLFGIHWARFINHISHYSEGKLEDAVVV